MSRFSYVRIFQMFKCCQNFGLSVFRILDSFSFLPELWNIDCKSILALDTCTQAIFAINNGRELLEYSVVPEMHDPKYSKIFQVLVLIGSPMFMFQDLHAILNLHKIDTVILVLI